MTYQIDSLHGTDVGYGYMPIPCGSLVNGTCPLKKDQTITYSVPFQLVSRYRLWSLMLFTTHRMYLIIDMYGTVPLDDPIFRFVVRIDFEFCLLHVTC